LLASKAKHLSTSQVKMRGYPFRPVPLLRAGVQPTLDPNVGHCVACPGLSL